MTFPNRNNLAYPDIEQEKRAQARISPTAAKPLFAKQPYQTTTLATTLETARATDAAAARQNEINGVRTDTGLKKNLGPKQAEKVEQAQVKEAEKLEPKPVPAKKAAAKKTESPKKATPVAPTGAKEEKKNG
jgi:hypothetical protein